MHKNETFALAWDQGRAYWSKTRGLRRAVPARRRRRQRLARLPFADTQQYNDGGRPRAQQLGVRRGLHRLRRHRRLELRVR